MISFVLAAIAACTVPAVPAFAAGCNGGPCGDPTHCRSKWGWCGTSSNYCNDFSTWRPSCGEEVTATTSSAAATTFLGTTTTTTQTTTTTTTTTARRTTTTKVGGNTGSCSGEPCADASHCRSKWGHCGAGSAYCNDDSTWKGAGCGENTVTTTPPSTTPSPTPGSTSMPSPTPDPTSTPAPSPPGLGIEDWFTKADFDAFFPNINNAACTGRNFFSHAALVQAASAFPDFASSGDFSKDQLELAAFLAQTSHETTGGWATAPGGPQAWGYCFKEEVGCETGTCTGYCAAGNPCAQQGIDCSCATGQTYQGRGPMQLSWNYNYGAFSEAIFGAASVLIDDPSRVASDPVVAYEAALWFWMTPQAPKPSCHDVITGTWQPSAADTAQGLGPGYGMTTNIINGGLECNMPTNGKVTDRVEFYKRYAGLLNVAVDPDTLYCNQMVSYR